MYPYMYRSLWEAASFRFGWIPKLGADPITCAHFHLIGIEECQRGKPAMADHLLSCVSNVNVQGYCAHFHLVDIEECQRGKAAMTGHVCDHMVRTSMFLVTGPKASQDALGVYMYGRALICFVYFQAALGRPNGQVVLYLPDEVMTLRMATRQVPCCTC